MAFLRRLHGCAQRFAVQPGLPSLAAQAALAKPADGKRVDTMLLGLHARCQTRLIVVRRHRNPRLDHRRTCVELLGHEVHGRAMLGLARLENAPMRVQAWILGQQRRVDVQYSAGISAMNCADSMRMKPASTISRGEQPRTAAASSRS